MPDNPRSVKQGNESPKRVWNGAKFVVPSADSHFCGDWDRRVGWGRSECHLCGPESARRRGGPMGDNPRSVKQGNESPKRVWNGAKFIVPGADSHFCDDWDRRVGWGRSECHLCGPESVAARKVTR